MTWMSGSTDAAPLLIIAFLLALIRMHEMPSRWSPVPCMGIVILGKRIDNVRDSTAGAFH